MLAGAAAVLVFLSAMLPLVLLDAAGSLIDWLRDPEWQLLSAMALVLTWLMPFVMVAIYACQAAEAGALGLGGLATAVIGLLAYSGFAFDMALVWPILAARAPELADFAGPMFVDPRFAFVHTWMKLVHLVGVLLFGAALLKARVFPRKAIVGLTLGFLMMPGVLFPPFLLRAVGGIVEAWALAWIGLALWRRVEARRQPDLRCRGGLTQGESR